MERSPIVRQHRRSLATRLTISFADRYLVKCRRRRPFFELCQVELVQSHPAGDGATWGAGQEFHRKRGSTPGPIRATGSPPKSSRQVVCFIHGFFVRLGATPDRR